MLSTGGVRIIIITVAHPALLLFYFWVLVYVGMFYVGFCVGL